MSRCPRVSATPWPCRRLVADGAGIHREIAAHGDVLDVVPAVAAGGGLVALPGGRARDGYDGVLDRRTAGRGHRALNGAAGDALRRQRRAEGREEHDGRDSSAPARTMQVASERLRLRGGG